MISRKLIQISVLILASLVGSKVRAQMPSVMGLMRKQPTGALVAWWKFEEGSYNGTSGEAKDSGGNSLDATAVSTANTTASGKYGNGLTLNGTSDYLAGTNAAQLNFGTGNHSIALWLKTTGNTIVPFGKMTSSTSGGYGLYINSSGFIRYRMYVNNTLVDGTLSSVAVNDGTWHHVVATVNRTGNVIVYVDGVSSSTTDISANSAYSNDTATVFSIGARGNATLFFGGQIDDCAVWNRVLTPAEVTTVHNSQPY